MSKTKQYTLKSEVLIEAEYTSAEEHIPFKVFEAEIEMCLRDALESFTSANRTVFSVNVQLLSLHQRHAGKKVWDR